MKFGAPPDLPALRISLEHRQVALTSRLTRRRPNILPTHRHRHLVPDSAYCPSSAQTMRSDYSVLFFSDK